MESWRFIAALAALALTLLCEQANAADRIFQIPFTSDLLEFDTGIYGPDGPWHAAVIMLGKHQRTSITADFTGGVKVPVWPTGSTIVQLLTTQGGGLYNSSNATKPWAQFGNGGDNDMRLADWYGNQFSEGVATTDFLSFMNFRLEDPNYGIVNASVYAMNTSKVVLPDGRSYKPVVGNLGLGRPADTEFQGLSMLEQLKSSGQIGSNSFGLHMGHVSLNQRGSFFLGGYDESRVFGRTATFDMRAGVPIIFMLDVVLGVEMGRWPFAVPGPNISLWPAEIEEGDGRVTNSFFGGREGSVLVTPNPAVPGIYLPAPTCANAAKHLPVQFDTKLGYYLWKTSDPAYHQTVNSAAYLGFVIADRQAVNLTIKVPLKALNLTLESPITEIPTPYFPCFDVSSNGSGYWELGRAVLQSTFFAVNFDQNVTHLAQAPGPDTGQSLVRAIKPGDQTLSVSTGNWADTWRAHWTAMDAEPSNSRSVSLSPGAIAGVVIGVISGVVLILGGYFAWRKRKRTLKWKGPVELGIGGKHRVKRDPGPVAELDKQEIYEAGNSPVLELESPAQLSEAPASPAVYEMPADTCDEPMPEKLKVDVGDHGGDIPEKK